MHKRHHLLVNIFGLLVLLGLVIFLASNNKLQLEAIFNEIEEAKLSYLAIGFLVFLSTYLFGAFSYIILLAHKIKFLPILVIQLASGFTNKIIPGGFGGPGITIYYLQKKGLKIADASAVVSVNTLSGFIIALVIFLIILPIATLLAEEDLQFHALSSKYVVIIMAVLAALLVTAATSKKIRRFFKNYTKSLASYRHKMGRVAGSMLSNFLITIANGLVMYLVTKSLGLDVSLLIAFLAMYASSLLGGLSPTPGGLGGSEAAIVAVLVAAGVSAESAIAVSLLFRLITYWLPLVSGAAAFIEARAQKWI